MTDQVPTSTSSAFTGEHPVYKAQKETPTYETAESPQNDTPREGPPQNRDFVVLSAPPTAPYIRTTIDVTEQALRRAIAALNEDLRQRA